MPVVLVPKLLLTQDRAEFVLLIPVLACVGTGSTSNRGRISVGVTVIVKKASISAADNPLSFLAVIINDSAIRVAVK